MMQHTVKKTISFSGVGLHTGGFINVRILPDAASTGITFVRRDLPGSPSVKATCENVVDTSYATTLGRNGVTVSTVEHLMAALYSFGIDNARVELDGSEVPILDGSACHFIEMIEEAGLAPIDAPRKHLVIKKPIRVSEKDKYVEFVPSGPGETGLTIDYSIDFSHSFLSKQTFTGLFSKEVFKREVGSARTFGFLRDVEALRANGLAKGGSLLNAVVIGDNEVLNEGGLRYPDEFVRHKVLDLMGDLSIVGFPVVGHLNAYRSGHALNHMLIKKILESPSRWELSEGVDVRFRRHRKTLMQAVNV